MTQHRTSSVSGIEAYPDSEPTPGRLALVNHPILHSVRVRNHMAAEGIDETNY
jgi:hypothetical protein